MSGFKAMFSQMAERLMGQRKPKQMELFKRPIKERAGNLIRSLKERFKAHMDKPWVKAAITGAAVADAGLATAHIAGLDESDADKIVKKVESLDAPDSIKAKLLLRYIKKRELEKDSEPDSDYDG